MGYNNQVPRLLHKLLEAFHRALVKLPAGFSTLVIDMVQLPAGYRRVVKGLGFLERKASCPAIVLLPKEGIGLHP